MSKKTPESTFDEMVEIVKAEALKKSDELSKKLGKNVYPLVFGRPKTKEIFAGFIQEPSRAAKMEALDIMTSKNSMSMAGEMILSTSLLKAESHEAFSSPDSKYDDVAIGAGLDCIGHVEMLVNSLKKIEQYKITVDSSEYKKMEAYVSYYLHLNPDDMSEEDLIKNFERVKYVLNATGQLKFT